MSLDEKFTSIRLAFYQKIGELFEKIALTLGYPENPGMPIEANNKVLNIQDWMETMPERVTYFPPAQRPETWFEMIFGPAPKVEPLPRYLYETKNEGFYNFYVENFKNLFFLPDWLSEFIQIKLNICLDISALEISREIVFIGLVLFSQLIALRIALAWLIYINPYTFPWSYLVTSVDWTEEALQGLVPSVFGVNVTGSVFLGAIGSLADSLNNLVFTMPFLPSEGEPTRLVINNQIKDVLVFHYLPVLWYRYPIPNDIRQFWIDERPDILEYMQMAYHDLNLTLLPDNNTFIFF
jgi:hypothetical protein